MLSTYLQDVPEFVRRVTLWLAAHASRHLTHMQEGSNVEKEITLGVKLFSSLQALSYLEETVLPGPRLEAQVRIISYVLSLIDLEDVALEPYNLTYRPTTTTASGNVLGANDAYVGVNGSLLQVGAAVLLREKRQLTPYPLIPEPSCCTA